MRVYQFRHIRADGQCSHLFPEISRHGCLSAERCRRSVGESMTSPPAHGDGRTIFLIDGWSTYRRSLRLFVEAAGYRVVGEADSISAAAAGTWVSARPTSSSSIPDGSGGTSGPISRGFVSANHAVAIVLLTATPLATDVARQAHGASVDAQLTKEASPEEILATVAIALCGNLIVLGRGHPLHWERPSLTRREHEILTLVAAGYPNHVDRRHSVGRRANRSLPARERVPQARRPGSCHRGATGGGLWAPWSVGVAGRASGRRRAAGLSAQP